MKNIGQLLHHLLPSLLFLPFLPALNLRRPAPLVYLLPPTNLLPALNLSHPAPLVSLLPPTNLLPALNLSPPVPLMNRPGHGNLQSSLPPHRVLQVLHSSTTPSSVLTSETLTFLRNGRRVGTTLNDTEMASILRRNTKNSCHRAQHHGKAADALLFGIDESFDPCEDFYSFTCNKFIQQINLEDLGVSRFSRFDQAQRDVNAEIAAALYKVKVDDKELSKTERITKAAFDACVNHVLSEQTTQSVMKLLQYIADRFGGVPFLNHTIKSRMDIFGLMGRVEQERALGTFMSSWVSVDYKNVEENVLYLSQPALPMAREFYVLPQFGPELEARAKAIENVMKTFARDVLDDHEKYNDMIIDVRFIQKVRFKT
ncbi:hypothetical protein TELCIR_02081 [Teladorsagia circumcincta]|uniref:Peptidase M13 N-terminal domain-containing protein n=1 Tax=Teladorsagia circumcincta TaxID=45464 RepID=A0A2G9V049_TELCI|nr:hypothetical protein TELCIR_02081 [Teladorsagia circumcincta]